MTIRKKILAIIMVTVLMTASIATLIGRSVATHALESQAKNHLVALSESRARTIEILLDYQQESVKLLASQASAYYDMIASGTDSISLEPRDYGAMSMIMHNMIASNKYVWQSFYITADGQVVASAFSPDQDRHVTYGTMAFEDWSQVDYSHLDWATVDSAQIDWVEVDYAQIDFNRLDLSRVDWTQVDWTRVDLNHIDFSQLDFSVIDWSKLDITQVDWRGVDLKGLNWNTINLKSINWNENDMSLSPIFTEGIKGPYAGHVYMYEGSREFVLAVSAPFYSGNRLKGVMAYFGGETALTNVTTDRNGLGDTGEVYLVDETGLMLTPSRTLEDAVLSQRVILPEFSIQDNDLSAISRENYLGKNVFGVYRHIPGTSWTSVVEKSRAEVLQPVSELTRNMVWAMLGLLGIWIILGIIVSEKMSASIVRLRHGAERIIAGDWSANVATNAKDEVGELSRAFGAMTANLQQSQGELHKYSSGLENQLAEREILLKEIHHRVKNNLQIISSLLNLQKYAITDETSRALFDESGRRVQSMALIHEQLYQSGDLAKINFDGYLRNLATNLISTYSDNSRSITVDVEANDVSLDIDTAVPCGLMVNELITNALKYAFPESWQECHDDADAPTLHLGTRLSDDQLLTLVVADNGIGFPEDIDIYNTETLGLQLVTSLASQLNASIEVERAQGTIFTIKIPRSNSTV